MDLMKTDNILTGNELDKYVKRSYELYKSYIEEAGLALKK
jgi:tripartite-type tricarboxylate transporter receptor subunit TctC